MPRIHIYTSQKTLDGINELVDEGLVNGATLAEVNKSSVAAELLEIGLRVKRMKKMKEEEADSPEDIYRHELFSECVKSRLVSQQILKLMFDLQEIKSDSRNNYDKLVDWMKNQTDARIESVLGEK
ncbi:relaxosome protein TraM [Pantoea agglomerans]|uniref:relaxosome protein TraM n=1 Tax=Enterobacter agglomerans TaxID=549 RepID=UPI002413A550|nr:relaxosome protein TraM [Pantoea agglomerans]